MKSYEVEKLVSVRRRSNFDRSIAGGLFIVLITPVRPKEFPEKCSRERAYRTENQYQSDTRSPKPRECYISCFSRVVSSASVAHQGEKMSYHRVPSDAYRHIIFGHFRSSTTTRADGTVRTRNPTSPENQSVTGPRMQNDTQRNRCI